MQWPASATPAAGVLMSGSTFLLLLSAPLVAPSFLIGGADAEVRMCRRPLSQMSSSAESIRLSAAGDEASSQARLSKGAQFRGVTQPLRLAKLRAEPLVQKERAADANMHIGIVGGGVSGVYAALTLAELGYTNVTILERELRVGGKAAAFEYKGHKYQLGAVSTPFALKQSSFTEAKITDDPLKFARAPRPRSTKADFESSRPLFEPCRLT